MQGLKEIFCCISNDLFAITKEKQNKAITFFLTTDWRLRLIGRLYSEQIAVVNSVLFQQERACFGCIYCSEPGGTRLRKKENGMNEELIIRHGTAQGVYPEAERFEEQMLRGRSLAMVYSPAQRFHRLYEPVEALLRRGTLFRELYKPFCPGGRNV